MVATKKAAAVTNHLSCCRSSPLEFLKRTTAATNPSTMAPMTAKNDRPKNGTSHLAEAGQSFESVTRGVDQRRKEDSNAVPTRSPQHASAIQAIGRQRRD